MENTTTDNNAINICKFSGIFLSFALSIGAMCVGYQPIAGIIFLASILILIGLSYLSFPTFQLNEYNAGLTSYTFLYILVSSIYTNDISLKGGFSLSALFKSFGFLSVILSAISVIINISYLIVTQKDNLQYRGASGGKGGVDWDKLINYRDINQGVRSRGIWKFCINYGDVCAS